MTTNNAISELPPLFFLYCSQKLFFWLCEICMSLCPKAQIIVWTCAFYWQRTIFFSLFYCLPKKKNKKTVWGWSNNLERRTGKIVCLWTCLTFIYFISCLLQISGIWIILMVSSTTMCACVFTATFTLCFDPSDLERWWFLELFTGWAQFKYGIKKDKLWHDFGGYSSFLFINGTFLGSL